MSDQTAAFAIAGFVLFVAPALYHGFGPLPTPSLLDVEIVLWMVCAGGAMIQFDRWPTATIYAITCAFVFFAGTEFAKARARNSSSPNGPRS